MFLPAFTCENKSLKQTVINAARSGEWLLTRRTSTDAVIVEEKVQLALSTAFMSVESEAEECRPADFPPPAHVCSFTKPASTRAESGVKKWTWNQSHPRWACRWSCSSRSRSSAPRSWGDSGC